MKRLAGRKSALAKPSGEESSERFRPSVVTTGVRTTPVLWTRQALATGGSGSKDQYSGAQLGSYG